MNNLTQNQKDTKQAEKSAGKIPVKSNVIQFPVRPALPPTTIFTRVNLNEILTAGNYDARLYRLRGETEFTYSGDMVMVDSTIKPKLNDLVFYQSATGFGLAKYDDKKKSLNYQILGVVTVRIIKLREVSQ